MEITEKTEKMESNSSMEIEGTLKYLRCNVRRRKTKESKLYDIYMMEIKQNDKMNKNEID